MRVWLALSLCLLTACHTEVKWAIRVPKESRDCSRDCYGAADDPAWQACIARCGGEVSQEWCDGTTLHHRDPSDCQQVETQKISVVWTILFVAGCVAAGGVALGVLSTRK